MLYKFVEFLGLDIKARNKMHNEENGKGKNDEEIYNSNEYISGAKRAQNGTVPMNILQFQYPFIIFIRLVINIF